MSSTTRAAGRRTRLTMPCDIETRRETPERRAAWHSDCPDPVDCACQQHQRDPQPLALEAER